MVVAEGWLVGLATTTGVSEVLPPKIGRLQARLANSRIPTSIRTRIFFISSLPYTLNCEL
jgi:hypothetical protein